MIGAQRAADLVSKMLAYSGGGRVVAEHVDLDGLVKEMVDLLGASTARHCTLIYNSPGPLPLVETDPTQIRQVVLNLIVNAAEAVDDAGVITVETGEESLDRAALKKMTFGDQRVGRPLCVHRCRRQRRRHERHTLARMFDPFYSTKDTGRGLGMAAVRGIVRSHRAALRVTSAEGQGTRFRVWFPLGLVDPLDQRRQRRHARTIDAVVEAGHVEQHALAQAGLARADHIDVIEIADVHGRSPRRRATARAPAVNSRGSGFSTPHSCESRT